MDFRRMTRVYWVVWAVAALVGGLAVSGLVSAQTPTASIVGTVLDPQGLPVEGANVALTNQGTNYTYNTTTSSTGAFQFSRIDSGLYRVAVTTANFRAAVVSDIKLDAATNYSVPPIKLEVGPKTETITVEAGAEVVNTTDTEVSSTVEKKQIDDLPVLNRNALALLGLEAGVSNSGPNGTITTTINGQRTVYSNLTLDGINIQDNLFRENGLDFVPNLPFNSQAQEFTVINQNAGVEYGNGSSQVALVTPKGTNTFHGEGFWYYRTNAWAANQWFNGASDVPLGKLIQNQGGGNLGGPIIKDKLFVYGYYELLRQRATAQNNATVISPDIYNSLTGTGTPDPICAGVTPCLPFTYTPANSNTGAPAPSSVTVNLLNIQAANPGRCSNPMTCAPPGTVFPADPNMLALMKLIPASKFNNTRVGDGTNLLGYQLNQRNDQTQDNTGIRVDYDLNKHNTISGTYAWNRQLVDRPDIDTSYDVVPAVQNDDHVNFASVAWRWSPTGTITNEARFGFNLAPAYFTTTQKFGNYILDDTTLPWTDPNPNFLPQGRNTRTWTGLDNASFTKGNHTIKFGGSVTRITILSTVEFTSSPYFIYPTYGLGFSSANGEGFVTSDFPGPGKDYSGTYQIANSDYNNAGSLAASVAGILSSVSQAYFTTSQTSGFVPRVAENRNYRQNQFAVYAGDNWRVNPRLTVNYGLRWDYFGPVGERDGLVVLPQPAAGQNIAQTMLGNATETFAGGNSRRGLYDGYWKAFAPNIGIAWDPFGDGKTAVRAAFSINYVNDNFFAAAENAASGNQGLSASVQNSSLAGPTVSNPGSAGTPIAPPFQVPTDLATLSAGLANTTGFIGGLAAYGIDPHLKPPQVQQWNLSIQRDIGWNTSLQVRYVGNHGVGLFRAVDLNQLNFNSGGFLADFNRARQNGFISLANTGVFNPLYDCSAGGTGCQALTVFPNLFLNGFLGFPSIANIVEQGQLGELLAFYHSNLFESNFLPPGPANNMYNWFPNPYIMGGDLLKNTSFSSYNAGIVELRRRFSRGLYFQANYAFSKTMTDFGGSQNQFAPFQDNARPHLERQRAPFDLTHAFKGNFTYELPMGRGHKLFSSPNRALGLLVNGWQVGSIFTWQSGQPFSILSTWQTFNRRAANNTAVATLTHQQISGDLGSFVQSNGVVYLINPKLINMANGTGAPSTPQMGGCTPAVSGGFCNPQPGEVGTLQLDGFSGPAYFDWDMSAAKDFNLTERFKLTFRTEAFNLLNHPVFSPYNQAGSSIFDINSTTFGQATQTVSQARILQMSLRLKF
jgi:hypothetical protein